MSLVPNLSPTGHRPITNCAQSLQSIHHLTKVQSLDLPVPPAWLQLPKHRSSRPPAVFSRVPLCTRLLKNHRDPIILLSRDPSRLIPYATCILQHRLGPHR
uniref:Uncharacterized protein n=1 Tax=Triticum urartu TaxID=4572 RepID=A0A8R7USV4_TRIUA